MNSNAFLFIAEQCSIVCVHHIFLISSSASGDPACFRVLSSVQSLSCVQLFATPWTAAHQASLSITNSQSLLKLVSIELVMPSSHLILCRPLLLLPSIFPSIRVFSNESVLCIRCLGDCKQCFSEHWGTRISFSSGFLSVYAQQWDCWVIWQFYSQFFKESSHFSP